MKKLFKTLLASALALTVSACTLPLSACWLDDFLQNGEEEGEQNQTVEGGQLSESEWKQAIDNTLAATSYKMTTVSDLYIVPNASFYAVSTDDDDDYEEDGTRVEHIVSAQVVEYDFANSVYHIMSETTNIFTDGENYSSQVESYYEATPGNKFMYSKAVGGNWMYYEEDELVIANLNTIDGIFADLEYRPVGTDVYGLISELYEYFTYDDEDGGYSAELSPYDGETFGETYGFVAHMTLYFKDGRLSGLKQFVDYGLFTQTIEIAITDYNKVTVTIPDEVKNAVS